MTDPVFPPSGATDCHTHVAGSAPRYPMVSPRAYTPSEATPAMMRAMMDRVGTERIVLVQMSVFGVDNSCMLDAMEALGPCSRGVVQLAEDVAGEELDRLHRLGVRGIRVNLNTTGLNDPGLARERLAVTAAQCARNGWHLQLFTSPAVIASLSDVLHALPVPVVLDHFGLIFMRPIRAISCGGRTGRIRRPMLAAPRSRPQRRRIGISTPRRCWTRSGRGSTRPRFGKRS
jgi:predicted TIM-barrel fold metal-dependent hydrolase